MFLRLDSILGACTLALLTQVVPHCSGHHVKRPRNVLIIALDTLRPDHLGCYGYSRPTSPTLDEFARTGFLFEDAQSSAAWTAPSLITVMTGLEPEVHQVIDSPNPGRMSTHVTTLAQILKENGFATAAFTEGGNAGGQFGLDQGFDEYPAFEQASADISVAESHESRYQENLDRTLRWLHGHHDKPFLLFFHTYEIHAPYRSPESFVHTIRSEFDADAERTRIVSIISTWNEKRTITHDDFAFLMPRALLLRSSPMWRGVPEIEDPAGLRRAGSEYGLGPDHVVDRPKMLQFARDLYDAGIASADDGLTRLFAGLREMGLDKNTLVVIVSDHGEGLGEHGQMEHGYVLHNEILHVLMLMRIPGTRFAPQRVSDTVRLVDVAPTVLDVLGIDATKYVFQGRSLLPALEGALPSESVLAHGRMFPRASDVLYSLRSGRWRLEFDLNTKKPALYDLENDPHELRDVAQENPELVNRMREEILRHHAGNLALREAIASEVSVQALDASTLKELKKFGYAGDDSKDR